jgi:hypothetical protein
LKKPSLIVSDEIEDIAVFDLVGIGPVPQKDWFRLIPENVYAPKTEDILVVLGFPGMWRASAKNRSSFQYGPLPFVVGDVSSYSIAIAEKRNSEVFEYLDSQPQPDASGDSCGGLSGAPAFFITPAQEIKLAGCVKHRACGALMMSRASLVMDLFGKREYA